MKYYEYYNVIKKYVNKSGKPYWIKRILLKDEEFINDANEWCSLHYLNPTKYPLKSGLKELINQYARQAVGSQFFIERVPYGVKKKILNKIKEE